MTETITLTLTRSEALALDALVNHSAERLFIDKNGGEPYALESWTKETAARACDKLHEAVLGEPSSQTWSHFLSNIDK